MAHETKQASTKEKNHGHGHNGEGDIAIADDKIEEIELTQKKTFYDHMTQVMEKFASNRMGQMIIEKTDRLLKVLEDTAKWSLPQDDCEIQLERPLPWILFLTLIVLLRVFRIWMSVVFYIVGSQPVMPHTMVYYIQTKRRRLRAIRVQGLKSIRSREIENTITHSSNKNASFIRKLRKLFSTAICKPGQYREVLASCVFAQDGKVENNTNERSTRRPRDDEAVDHNLTLHEMLEKYANENSDNDSDYIPKEDEEYDESSTSRTSSSSAEETEKENHEETNDNQKETKGTQKDEKPIVQKKEEIKENGGAKHRPKPKDLKANQTESPATVDSNKEEMHTPNEIANTNSSNDDKQVKTSEKIPAVSTEFASPSTSNTDKTKHLSAPLGEEQKQKSTPGHESAASFKPSVVPATKTGSPQDFHYIFHPAPLVKGTSGEAQTSTPKEADHHERSSSETPESIAADSQKNHLNNPTHNKQNHHHHQHHNNKNRNKNRR